MSEDRAATPSAAASDHDAKKENAEKEEKLGEVEAEEEVKEEPIDEVTREIAMRAWDKRRTKTTPEQFIRQQALLEAKFALYKKQVAEERRRRRHDRTSGDDLTLPLQPPVKRFAPATRLFELKARRHHFDAEDAKTMSQSRAQEMARERAIRQERYDEVVGFVVSPPVLPDPEDWHIYNCYLTHDPSPHIRFPPGTRKAAVLETRLANRTDQFSKLRAYVTVMLETRGRSASQPEERGTVRRSQCLIFLTENERDLFDLVKQLESGSAQHLITDADWARIRTAMALRRVWWVMTRATSDMETQYKELLGLLLNVSEIVRECTRRRQDTLAYALRTGLAKLHLYPYVSVLPPPSAAAAGAVAPPEAVNGTTPAVTIVHAENEDGES